MKAVDFKKIQSADLQSIGYSAASQGDVLSVLASELNRRYPNGLSDEAKAELEQGMVGRKAELMGTAYYVHKGSEYLPIDNPAKADKDDQVAAFTVQYAAGLSAYDFGQLKSKDKAQYDIIAAIRTATNKYKSNAMGDLLRAIERLKSGKGRSRSANKVMTDVIKAAAELLITRNNNAKKNGDPSAMPTNDELAKAIAEAIRKA